MRLKNYGEPKEVSVFDKYNKEELMFLFNELLNSLDSAEVNGFKDPYVTFQSTLEPYEDNTTGPVEIFIQGYVPLTPFEIAQEKEQKRITELSKDLGVSFYEASVVDRLRKAGKV
jgi:hypothetical protein